MLLWALARPRRLRSEVRRLLLDGDNEIFFSAASVWEVAIKSALGRRDFDADPAALCEALPRAGFVELPVTAAHAARVASLPSIHRDPFDRLLVAQAFAEPMTLLTNDEALRGYGALVKVV